MKPRKIGAEVAALSNLIKRLRPDEGEFDDGDMTNMQRWFIGFIRSRGDSRDVDVFQGDLEEHFNITRATASSILKRMEQNGLITRKPVSHDARLKKIVLTDRAIRHCDAVNAYLERIEDMMSRDIPDNEMETFFRVIDKINDNISKWEH